MAKKWLSLASWFIIFIGWVQASEQELKDIEQQIQNIKSQLNQDQLREMKEEVESQGYMIADWEKYSAEIQRIRQQEEEERQLELRLENLNKRKAQLMREQNQVKSS